MVSVPWQPSSYTTFLNFHEVQMFLKFGSHKMFLILIFPPSFAEELQRRIGKYSQQFSCHAALEWLLSGCVYPFPVPSACASSRFSPLNVYCLPITTGTVPYKLLSSFPFIFFFITPLSALCSHALPFQLSLVFCSQILEVQVQEAMGCVDNLVSAGNEALRHLTLGSSKISGMKVSTQHGRCQIA